MATITLRSVKGSALTHNEMDANLTNLNNDKIETSAIGVTVQAYSSNLDEYAAVNPTTAGLALLDDATAADQRTTLGLGTIATQAASSVAITGGTINSTSVGATTPSTGAFTTLSATGNVTLGDASTDSHTLNGTMTAATAAEILLDDSVTSATSVLPLAFDGDADTGLFRPAANTIAVATGGTERVRVDSSGNVGIGAAASASYLLDVQKTSVAGSTAMRVRNSDTSSGSIAGYEANQGSVQTLLYSGSNAVGRLYVTTNHPLQLGTNNTSRMEIDTSGNVSFQSSGAALTNVASINGKSPSAPIQSISASVAANALTISASALILDFRSTTLGSGTVTTVSGTPANLVISSGSTLGTVNNVQSDIVVLAINNAGTIELAAVNLAGGNKLDETNLISTTAEGGAGAADSANVIYSTTARTNVAYRVLGIIRSTQTTAGTWATAPSLIQGMGGQALAAMQSIGYGQTWQNVVASRALSTTYYNTTGKPIFVVVSLGTSGGTSTHTFVINGATIISTTGASASISTVNFFYIIPSGASYSATSSAGAIGTWLELR